MSDYTPTTQQVEHAYANDSEAEYRDPIEYPALVRQNKVEFRRWLAAHDAEKRAEWEAEQCQTEWEYGVSREVATPMSSREAAERQIERMAKRPKGYRLTANLVRRRVTPWVAAPDTTNNESED